MLFKNIRTYPICLANVNNVMIVLQPNAVGEFPDWYKDVYANVLEPIYLNVPKKEEIVLDEEKSLEVETIELTTELDETVEPTIEKKGRGRPKKV